MDYHSYICILEAKDYMHLTHMMEDITQSKLEDKTHDMIDYNTPTIIPCNIASIEQPPKDDIIPRLHIHNTQNIFKIIYIIHHSLCVYIQ